MKIGVITGSTRPARIGGKIAEWFKTDVAEKYVSKNKTVEFVYLDLAAENLPFFDEPLPPSAVQNGAYEHERTRAWASKIQPLDAIVIITPEYNRGPSAAEKNAIDLLYAEWNGKPISFVGYGSGGAARAIESLRSTSIAVGMTPIREHVMINIFQHMNESGDIDLPEYYVENCVAMLDQLTRYADLLAPLRKH